MCLGFAVSREDLHKVGLECLFYICVIYEVMPLVSVLFQYVGWCTAMLQSVGVWVLNSRKYCIVNVLQTLGIQIPKRVLYCVCAHVVFEQLYLGLLGCVPVFCAIVS